MIEMRIELGAVGVAVKGTASPVNNRWQLLGRDLNRPQLISVSGQGPSVQSLGLTLGLLWHELLDWPGPFLNVPKHRRQYSTARLTSEAGCASNCDWA